MLPQNMHVLGLLLTVCVATSMGQVNNTSTSNGTNGGSTPTSGGAKSTAPPGKIFGFDCRRLTAGCNGKDCDLKTGNCSCGSGTFSYNCLDISQGSVCSPPCADGTCNAGKCVCTENFYGANCNLTRVEVLCKGEQMFVNINPIYNFSGNIYVPGNNTCNFSNNSTVEAVNFQTELEKFPGLEGRWRVLEFNDINCGLATVTNDAQGTAYEFKIYVQYVTLFKSAVDQIVLAKCVVTNGTDIEVSSDVSSVADVDNKLDHVNADGKIDAVTLKVLSADGRSMANTVTLGDEIHLVFSMPVTNGSTYTDFSLKSCTANNTLPLGSGLQSLVFILNGCPTQEARSIFAGTPIKTTTATSTTTDVVLRAFVFVGSSQLLGFTCDVGLCTALTAGGCSQTNCSDKASTAPPSPAGNNTAPPSPAGNNTAPPSPAGNNTALNSRRKRDSANTPSEATVGANIFKVVVPGQQQETDSPSSNDGQVTGQKTAPPCAVNQFTAAVAILGVCVFLLLVLSACLIFQLMKSKKAYPERPDHYPRPVEGLRFPRLEMNNGHDNAF